MSGPATATPTATAIPLAPAHAPAPTLRIARPVTDLARTEAQWTAGLALAVLFRFAGDFDGIMLGVPGAAYHFEFTRCAAHPVAPAHSPEDLAVFYHPRRADFDAACARMHAAGWAPVPALNPYWAQRGVQFADADGYRVQIECYHWTL